MKKIVLLLAISLFLQNMVLAQHKVTGMVMDRLGEVLPGVSVREKGSADIATITDVTGKYSMSVSNDSAVLVFKFIGMKSIEMPVNGRSNLPDVIMEEALTGLDEVVVVGYGTSSKRALISSVSNVKSEQINELPVTNMTQGLAGRSPGLIVVGHGGGVNKKQDISIRGGGTPLVVIDGIIRGYDDFVSLQPEDIESISILKDASATAVYGSRATNGIIQITTKMGTEGTPSIKYNFNQSWAQPAIWSEKLDVWDRAKYANIARQNDGLGEVYSPEAIQKMRDGSDPEHYPNTDWRGLVMNNWAPQTKHSVQMTGGSKINQYFVSIGRVDQNSLYKSNNHYLDRTNVRLSHSGKIEKIGISTTATAEGYFQETSHPYTSTAGGYYQVFSHIQNKSPLEHGLNKYGLPYISNDTPVGEVAEDAGYNKNNEKNGSASLQIKWDLPWVEGLQLRAKGYFNYVNKTHKGWRKDPALYDWDSKTPQYANKPKLFHSALSYESYTMQYFAEYKKTFNEHSINVLAGYEATSGKGNYYDEERRDYDFAFDQLNIGPATTQTNSGYEYDGGRTGIIGQIKYNYAKKYFLEGSIRYDGSDNFPKDRRKGAFYSGSVGWIVSDEDFMQVLKETHILDLFKFRASYGQVGLDNWARNTPYHIGRFEYLSSYNFTPKGYVVNGKYVPGFSEGAIPSPDITWFTTEQSNIGFDFETLDSKLYGSFDYFYYQTTGFLYKPDPLKVGYTDPLGQSLPRVKTDGQLRRGGFEFQLGWKDKVGELSYDVSLNLTRYTQFWNRQPAEGPTSLMNPYTRSTQEYGYYGTMLTSEGYYTDANDVLNSPKREASYNLTAGDIKYKDINGDGKIDGDDNTRLGKQRTPRANYGLNVNMSYKGFGLGLLLQGAPAFDMYAGNALRMSSGQVAGGMWVIYDFQEDYWTPDNTGAKFPRLMSNPGLNGGNNYQYSDFWLISGAYIRLKDFNISYDFKYKLLKNIKWLSTCRLSITGQNVLTFSEVKKYGLDPENSNMEHYGYPNERVFALNLNIGF